MARIVSNEFNLRSKERNSIHEQTKATYSIFCVGNEKYIQIDTYGSPDREVKGIVSQSIQFDKKSALLLIDIINKEFN